MNIVQLFLAAMMLCETVVSVVSDFTATPQINVFVHNSPWMLAILSLPALAIALHVAPTTKP